MNYYAIIIALFVGLFACEKPDDDDDKKEEKTPIAIDFSVDVTGEAPSAVVTITNKTTGAESYSWTISQGSETDTSSSENPSAITIDKTGDLTIKLVATNKDTTAEKTETVTITGNNAILEFKDVEFAIEAGNATYGRYFSIELGKIIKDSEVTADNGPKIDLVFASMVTMYYFDSPDNADYNITGGTKTLVMNYLSNDELTVDDFDKMESDSLLKTLKVSHADDSFGSSTIPNIILFKNAAGKIGAIKAKEVKTDVIVADIKVQKY